MKLKDQVVSLELSKQLRKLGVKQESLFYWYAIDYFPKTIEPEYELYALERISEYSDTFTQICSAVTVAELGEMLPRCYSSWATPQNGELKWWCHRMEGHFVTHEETQTFTAETEADARAKMLIYLIENDLIKQ